MMPFSNSSRASLVGFAALTVILTAGAAQSLSGSNTVFSDDIVDGQVKFVDIKPSAVTSSRIATNAVTSSDVRDFSLTNQDVGVLFAQINAAGTVANSSGGVTAIPFGGGFYEVDFGRNVSNCAPLVTQGGADVGSATGAITAATDRFGNVEAFFISIQDAAGTGVNRDFHIAAVC